MSAPDTDTKTQEKEHRGPLIGIWAALVVVALLLVWWLAYATNGEEPEPGQAAAPASEAQQEAAPAGD
ncbi:hypothetical protein [Alloyangia pacifica]|uniref:Uncharacterized protein n=1 Tax=Alloyangia pacifica TaxID=311180 RepID=A0A1I6WBC1_9RHOB|nr:hypothetical protein [Alloyangia pacifica]SDI48694.1 hypothetical protein SAMN04488245_11724 [Alloyangia pacifica]SFT23285.1 hypothetical protein SAMN04488050_11777 [Alloyangia pacifica]